MGLMNLKAMLNYRDLTPTYLHHATGLSRATITRIMAGRAPSDRTLTLIADAMEVSPGYLRGDKCQLPAWLTEEDIIFLADRRNVPMLRVFREAAGKGLSSEDFKKLREIIERYP